ncbi:MULTISPECIES: patatin-like phospholipase family protein [Actinokineospora]|uniref:Patatin family protein n=1 Tax=Actinokineospora fastidiosa TaxID=1816 RepID=A0A918G7K2_9PSEU|nr:MULTISPECIES: patatin family protein [Actinokineospora]UVS82102.1 Patatin-like phospholipase [Actinokineospora sp. UTMC 2448]GGS23512.1 patatin family protein [Actinokineospora fastidiosa]
MHAVREILLARRSGAADDARVALAIEGGASRGAYSGGMAAALVELGFGHCFDAVYGASAGALNGAWFLSGQAVTGVLGWSDPLIMRRVTNPWRALTGGPVVDTEHLVERIYPAVPMDFAAILANPTTFHPLATDIATGAAVDLAPTITDAASLRAALRASTALPMLAGRPVRIGAHSYIDAGIAESVPFRTAVAQGATHVLVLRTRPDAPLPVPSRVETSVVTRYLRRAAPGAVEAWTTRHTRVTADEAHLADHTEILQIRPPEDGPEISRLTRDPFLLRRAVRMGHHAVITALG